MQVTQTLIDVDTDETITPEGFACGQFLMCENEATCFIDHPILDWVPACDRCLAKAQRLEAM